MEVEAARYLEAGLIPEPPASIVDFVKANYDMTRVKTAMYEGKIFGVPLFQGQGALFYNTEMFAKAGLDGPPKTMADYTGLCAEARAARRAPACRRSADGACVSAAAARASRRSTGPFSIITAGRCSRRRAENGAPPMRTSRPQRTQAVSRQRRGLPYRVARDEGGRGSLRARPDRDVHPGSPG